MIYYKMENLGFLEKNKLFFLFKAKNVNFFFFFQIEKNNLFGELK